MFWAFAFAKFSESRYYPGIVAPFELTPHLISLFRNLNWIISLARIWTQRFGCDTRAVQLPIWLTNQTQNLIDQIKPPCNEHHLDDHQWKESVPTSFCVESYGIFFSGLDCMIALEEKIRAVDDVVSKYSKFRASRIRANRPTRTDFELFGL